MQTSATANLITVDDYRELPEGPPHYQLIEGKLHLSPSPTRYHQVVCRNIQFLLMKYLDQHPVGEVFQAPSDVYLTDYDVYQPDLFYVSNENAAVPCSEKTSCTVPLNGALIFTCADGMFTSTLLSGLRMKLTLPSTLKICRTLRSSTKPCCSRRAKKCCVSA